MSRLLRQAIRWNDHVLCITRHSYKYRSKLATANLCVYIWFLYVLRIIIEIIEVLFEYILAVFHLFQQSAYWQFIEITEMELMKCNLWTKCRSFISFHAFSWQAFDLLEILTHQCGTVEHTVYCILIFPFQILSMLYGQ